jgi:hypothetical protein
MVTIDSNPNRFAQMEHGAMIVRSWPRWFTRLPARHGSPAGTTRRCAPRPSGVALRAIAAAARRRRTLFLSVVGSNCRL